MYSQDTFCPSYPSCVRWQVYKHCLHPPQKKTLTSTAAHVAQQLGLPKNPHKLYIFCRRTCLSHSGVFEINAHYGKIKNVVETPYPSFNVDGLDSLCFVFWLWAFISLKVPLPLDSSSQHWKGGHGGLRWRLGLWMGVYFENTGSDEQGLVADWHL